MKRRLLTIALCLLLGAVVNVAVAWGCTFWSPVGSEIRTYPVPARVVAWFDQYCPLDVELPIDSDLRSRHGTGVHLRKMSDWIEAKDCVVSSWRATAGLPMHCFDGVVWEYGGIDGPNQYASTHARSLPLTIGPFQLRNIHYGAVLPLRPVWPGFALNTLFYAAILWLLIPGPFVLRRFLRVKRGLCPKCAYPMGESEVCTECGYTLPKRASPT